MKGPFFTRNDVFDEQQGFPKEEEIPDDTKGARQDAKVETTGVQGDRSIRGENFCR